MSRRKFIQQSAVLTGGLLLQNAFAKNVMVPDEILTAAVIGTGDRGQGIMGIMNTLPQFNITAICDLLDFRIEAAKKINPDKTLKIYRDYTKLLDDQTIQCVIISTPLYLHYSIAKDALAAGKHVYLEKTMTYSAEQAIALVQLLKKHPKQVFQVGHQYRYVPMCFRVKEMIEKDYLGKVTQIDCRWDRNGSWRRKVPEGYTDKQINWRMYKEYSGGLTAELLSHQIDFINWAFDTHPDEILAAGGIDFYKDGRETYDNMQVMLRYNKAGMIGNFGATCGNAREGYIFKIKGTKGTVELLMDEGFYYPEAQTKKALQTVDGVTGATKIEWNKDGGMPIMNEKAKDGTYYALKDFYDCIKQQKLPPSNVITGATTACCVALANKAAYTQTIQQWKPEYNFI